MNFYHAANASKAVKLSSGKRVTFEVFRYFGGCWEGVAACVDPETIEGLDELVRKPRSGIKAITKEQYEANIKKKVPLPNSQLLRVSPPLLQPPQAPLALVDGRRVARLVAGGEGRPSPVVEKPAAAPAKVYDAVDDFLSVGTVNTINTDPAPKSRGSGERSANSQGRPSRRPKYSSEPPPE